MLSWWPSIVKDKNTKGMTSSDDDYYFYAEVLMMCCGWGMWYGTVDVVSSSFLLV
jgi:hypothetical protein